VKTLLKRQLKRTDDTKEIIGHSEQIQRFEGSSEKVADSDSTILSSRRGTGRSDREAIPLHEQARRGPFVSINCGALPGSPESNLFGHVKGSFTAPCATRGALAWPEEVLLPGRGGETLPAAAR